MRRTIPTELGMVIEEVCRTFYRLPFSDPMGSFAARGYLKFVKNAPTEVSAIYLCCLFTESDQIKKVKVPTYFQ